MPAADSVRIELDFFSYFREVEVLLARLVQEFNPVTACMGCVDQLNLNRASGDDASAARQKVTADDRFEDTALA